MNKTYTTTNNMYYLLLTCLIYSTHTAQAMYYYNKKQPSADERKYQETLNKVPNELRKVVNDYATWEKKEQVRVHPYINDANHLFIPPCVPFNDNQYEGCIHRFVNTRFDRSSAEEKQAFLQAMAYVRERK